MTKTIYLLRHGQTYFNYYHKVQGRCDSPLTKVGIGQVEKAQTYFQKHDIHFDLAFASTQERACDTLEIATNHQMPYERLKDLREKCYGIFEGRDEFLLPWNYGNKNIDPTMEKDTDVVNRMSRAIDYVLSKLADGQTALVVGHGDILARYVRSQTDKSNFAGFNNAAFVKLTFNDQNQAKFESYVWPSQEA